MNLSYFQITCQGLAALILIVTYNGLIREIYYQRIGSINPLSFLLWCGLSSSTAIVAYYENDISVVILKFTLIMASFQFIIAMVAFWKNDRKSLLWQEWVAMLLAIVILVLWYQFHEIIGSWAVLLLIIADIFAVIPEVKQIKNAPLEDEPKLWLIFSVVATLVILGLPEMDIKNLGYPIFEFCVGKYLYSISTQYRKTVELRV